LLPRELSSLWLPAPPPAKIEGKPVFGQHVLTTETRFDRNGNRLPAESQKGGGALPKMVTGQKNGGQR